MLLFASLSLCKTVQAWTVASPATQLLRPYTAAFFFGSSTQGRGNPHSTISSANSFDSSNRKTSALFLASSEVETTTTAKKTTTIVVSPQTDDIVTIKCRLQPQGDYVPEPLIDGVVWHDASCDDDAADIDHEGEILQFVLNRGNYLPGLHDLIYHNMTQIGQRVVNVPLDAGWGKVNPNLIATVSYDQSGLSREQIKVGTQLRLSNGLECVVTDVNDDTFTMNGNPPLAGAYYWANVTLLDVQPGPLITGYRKEQEPDETVGDAPARASPFEVATFALGCFWYVCLTIEF